MDEIPVEIYISKTLKLNLNPVYRQNTCKCLKNNISILYMCSALTWKLTSVLTKVPVRHRELKSSCYVHGDMSVMNGSEDTIHDFIKF